MFAYCLNNPILGMDASGHSFERAVDGFGFISSLLDKDFQNFKWDNDDPEDILESNIFSAYKNKLVVRLPIDNYGVSFGVIGIGNNVADINVVKHEYGHTLQFKEMKVAKYTTTVAIPSITINILDRNGKLPYDYYSYPWEAEANKLGGADLRQKRKEPLPAGSNTSFQGLIKLFFE